MSVVKSHASRWGEKTIARAAAGAALLDRLSPGWWRHVKIRQLDIADQCNCVTGQLFGSYYKGLDALDLGEDEAKEYGFNTFSSNDRGSTFWALTRAWKDEIRKRREGAKVGRQR